MFKRRRFKQQLTLQDRLDAWSKQLKGQAEALPLGPARDALVKKARQADVANHGRLDEVTGTAAADLGTLRDGMVLHASQRLALAFAGAFSLELRARLRFGPNDRRKMHHLRRPRLGVRKPSQQAMDREGWWMPVRRRYALRVQQPPRRGRA